MTEAGESDLGAAEGGETQLDAGTTAGGMLRAAREAAGLHVAALAVSLKVPPRKLEALEAGRHDELGDAVFVRALAASVCRALKVDARPVLDKLPQGTRPRLQDSSHTLNAPMPVGSMSAGLRNPAHWLMRPAILIALVLGVAALGLLWLPPVSELKQRIGLGGPESAGLKNEAPGFPPGAAPGAATDASAPAGSLARAQDSQSARDAGSSVPVPSGPQLAASPSIAASSLSHALTPPSGQSPETSVSAGAMPAAPVQGVGLVIRAKDRSWVDVSAMDNTPILRKVLSNESVEVPLTGPVRVTIGNAASTTLQVRGREVDLAAATRDNVARLELK